MILRKNCYATDDLPPSTPTICPVIHELSLVNKNLATDAVSLPSPILLVGAF